MTYKETLFFVGKCLTINHEAHNKRIVEDHLKINTVDWDNVVKLSTEHYVFPALYCNLRKADFLKYLPEDLVGYMKHITDLNRERNTQIIQQAKEINELLLSHNINPIFLKGTGNLLEGLYDDIAERMVGDIDILFSPKEVFEAYEIIIKASYIKTHNDYSEIHRHLSPLVHKNKISRIEVHKEMTISKFAKDFNYKTINTNLFKKDNFHFLNYIDQVKLTIIAKQINDHGQYYNDISLRNVYDLYLLSQKTDVRTHTLSSNKKLSPHLNNFLATTKITSNSEFITFEKNKKTENYIKLFLKLIDDNEFRKRYRSKTKNKIRFLSISNKFLKAFYKKEYFKYITTRVKSYF